MTYLESTLCMVIFVLIFALAAAIREIKTFQKVAKFDGKANADFNNLYHKYLKLSKNNHELILMNQTLLDELKKRNPFYMLKGNGAVIAKYCKN